MDINEILIWIVIGLLPVTIGSIYTWYLNLPRLKVYTGLGFITDANNTNTFNITIVNTGKVPVELSSASINLTNGQIPYIQLEFWQASIHKLLSSGESHTIYYKLENIKKILKENEEKVDYAFVRSSAGKEYRANPKHIRSVFSKFSNNQITPLQ